MTQVTHRLDRLTFSGKAEDFIYFQEQFESRMCLLKLRDTLLDKVTVADGETEALVQARAEREDNRLRVWCELIQTLDKKTMMLVRRDKPNGAAAWRTLISHFRSTERPRIHKTLTDLTSLTMNSEEALADYFARAEEMQMDLEEADQAMSDTMFVAMVLKGLPKQFETMVTLVNHGEEKPFPEIKQDLINFANTNSSMINSNNGTASAFHVQSKVPKCFHCGKMGHKKPQCRSFQSGKPPSTGTGTQATSSQPPRSGEVKLCFKCNKPGHIARFCRSNPVRSGEGQPGAANFCQSNYGSFSFMAHQDDEANQMEDIEFIIDSGCSGYMIKDKELFVDFDEGHKEDVRNANQSSSRVEGRGTVLVHIKDSYGNYQKVFFNGALFVPSYSHNLLSVKRLTDAGVDVVFGKQPVLKAPGNTSFPFLTKNNLYVLKGYHASIVQQRAMKAETVTRWHERLGHVNRKDVKALGVKVNGMDMKDDLEDVCKCCATQKAKRCAVPKQWGTRATKVLEIVHMDVLGPLDVEATTGERYGIGFIDSFSRYAAVYLMRTRDECISKFQQFIADVGHPRTLVTDGAKEFTSRAFADFCREQKIRHEYSAPYIPEDNGKIERIWGTVVNMARSMVNNASMKKQYWGFALKAAFYIKNRCLHAAIGQTPYEAFHGVKPDVSHMRVFGCQCFILEEVRKKLDPKATEGVFLGYSNYSNAYIVSVPSPTGQHRVYLSRSVTFNENVFFFGEKREVVQQGVPDSMHTSDTQCEIQEDVKEASNPVEPEPEEEVPAQPLVISHREPRVRQAPAFFGEPVSWDTLDWNHQAFVSDVMDSEVLPATAEDALTDKSWHEAMQKEFTSLIDNGVWKLVKRPTNRKVVKGKWHFAVKRNSDGSISKYKARFVAKGFTQVFGVDYNETYAPTAKLSTLRTLLACAGGSKTIPWQMDIKTAYLHANIEEEIFLEQPQGFEEGDNMVCLLIKSLYGLKQAGRNWYGHLRSHLESMDFKVSSFDSCLFVKEWEGSFGYVCIWVDDIYYYCQDLKFFDWFKDAMSAGLTIGDIGPLQWFLGMQISCNGEQGIRVNQSSYVQRLLQRFGMDECKPSSTPLADKVRLSKDDSPDVGSMEEAAMHDKDYRGIVGSINYLATTTRPDLAYAAHALSRFVNNPGLAHWTAAKHVLRYLKGSKDAELVYKGIGLNPELIGYCDSDYAAQPDSRRSTAGYCFFVGSSAAISWGSRLQPTVATSTTEAEVSAAVEATKEASYLMGLLKSMGYTMGGAKLLCDSQSCIALSKNPIQKAKTKHYAVRLEFLREACAKDVQLVYVPTEANPADLLTKPVGKLKTGSFKDALLNGVSDKGVFQGQSC